MLTDKKLIPTLAIHAFAVLCWTQPMGQAPLGGLGGTTNYPPTEAIRLVEIALKQNPALVSARFYADAAHSNGDHHGAWEAPEVGVEFYQTPLSSFPNPIKDQREIDYSVSQTIPFPGKLSAMAEPEHLRGEAEESRTEALALNLRQQVLSAYADRYFAGWRLQLIREDRMQVARLLGTARAGYEGGMGTQADLLRAESETARLDAEALQAEERRIGAQVSLSALMGGSVDTSPQVDSLFPNLTLFPLDNLRKAAVARRPDLEAMSAEVDMADAEIAAKRKEAYPDFMVRGTYKDMLDGGPRGFWSVMGAVKVPIAPWSWKGVRAGVDQARVLHRKSEQDYNSQKLMIQSEVDRAAAALASASGRIELAQSRRIPLARQVLSSMLAAYQGGKTDFNNVLMAFRELRMAREEYHMAVSDHLKAWADLEYATGGPIVTPVVKD